MTLASYWLTQIRDALTAMEQQDLGTTQSVLDKLLAHLSDWEPYLRECTTPESLALQTLWAKTMSIEWEQVYQQGLSQNRLMPAMVSGHLVGQLLKMLLKISGATQVLEIGTFTGYSALAMAEVLPPQGIVIACESDPYAAQVAEQNCRAVPWGDKVTIKVGPAQSTLEQLAAEGKYFDFVFLDADKRGYIGYLQTLLDRRLLRSGGILCADNTLFSGQVWSKEPGNIAVAMQEFNRIVATENRVEQLLLPLRDGVTLIRCL